MRCQLKELTVYDATDAFEEIRPLIKRIDIICKANKIPYMFAACVKNDENGSEYSYDGNFCGSNEIVLKDDKITDFIRILAGFRLKTDGDGYEVKMEDDIQIDF